MPTRLLCPWDFSSKDIGVSCHFFLQGILLTQGSNSYPLSFLHCRQILYPLHYHRFTIYSTIKSTILSVLCYFFPPIIQDQKLHCALSRFLGIVKWSEVKSLSCVRLFATPWTVANQAPPSMGFSRQEYCSGFPFPSPVAFINYSFLLLHIEPFLQWDHSMSLWTSYTLRPHKAN